MFFGRIGKIKNIFYTGLIITAVFLFWNVAKMETETGDINVNMNVPSVGNHCTNGVQDSDETGIDCGGVLCAPCGGCSGYCGPDPIIDIVASNTGFYQATLVWTVDPGSGYSFNTTSIMYGINFSLTSTTIVTVSGTEFVAVMNNLEADTDYDFEIYASNSGGGIATKVGQFITQKVIILNNLTILAKPEKRIFKENGNYNAAASLLFFDQTSNSILFISW
ncbi:MAG: fibronectin type III domain-containing protein [Candidatus Magasanikbacteria bacterium]|nr:fibronectin type III domain-containing protein [Candidatus Magasanikbacteria bacterium]